MWVGAETFSKLEDKIIEITKSEEWEEKRLNKNEERLRDLWYTI